MGPSEEHRERSTAIYAESPLYAALAVTLTDVYSWSGVNLWLQISSLFTCSLFNSHQCIYPPVSLPFLINASSLSCHASGAGLGVELNFVSGRGGGFERVWGSPPPPPPFWLMMHSFITISSDAGAVECTGPSPKLLGSAALTKHGHSSCQTEDKHTQWVRERTTGESVMEEGESDRAREKWQ